MMQHQRLYNLSLKQIMEIFHIEINHLKQSKTHPLNISISKAKTFQLEFILWKQKPKKEWRFTPLDIF